MAAIHPREEPDALTSARTTLEPLNKAFKASNTLVANRLRDFVDNVYLPHVESKRKPSTYRGYRQMWLRYLKPRCASALMHDIETRGIQQLLDAVAREDGIAPQTLQHNKHLLGGVFRFAISQGHLPRGTVNPVAFWEIQAVPDFDGRAYSLEEIALMLTVLPESIAAMILRHANDRVTRKHYIKPPTLEAIAAMRRLSEFFSAMEKPGLLPTCSPERPSEAQETTTVEWVVVILMS